MFETLFNRMKDGTDKGNTNSQKHNANIYKRVPNKVPKTADRKNDWANTSGIYRKLSEDKKRYIDKIINALEQVLEDNR